MYLFDTTYIIDLINEDKGAVKKAKEIDSTPVFKAISVITVQEYLRGIYYLFSENEKLLNTKLNEAEKELSYFDIIPIDYSIARLAAQTDANLMQKSTPVSIADVLIATSAIKYNLTVITRNQKDFEKIAMVTALKIKTY